MRKQIIKLWFFILYMTMMKNINVFPVEHLHNKPFRVALVIGDQWKDPMSYMITSEQPGDFFSLTILLKSWGIPFDIFRLDQQFLDRNMFLGPDGKPMYGTIIWDVNKSKELLHPDYQIISDMVTNYGIGFIALSDRIQPFKIQSLLGIKYIGAWRSNTDLEIVHRHFLTKDLTSPLDLTDGPTKHKLRVQVELEKGTQTLVKQGPYPQVTTKIYDSGAHVVWIGSDYNKLFSYQGIRTLLRRAITWTIGYNLYKTWDNQIIMIMDDPGSAQCAWLEHWHYPTLSEEIIERYLIKPLQEHNAVLNVNVVPGFVNDEKRWVEPTWQQNFVDEFGTQQDYISTKRGLDKGLKISVFQIMCHGLTHMQPDLASPPIWYDAKLDQERAEVGWYREFGDRRRNREIPAAEQFWRMKIAQKWIAYQFGVTSLEFLQGGGSISKTYANNTFRLAGRAGFGWYGFGYDNEKVGYLGQDMVIVGWDFYGTLDSPLFDVAPPNAHDFGVAIAPEEFTTIFKKYPDKNFIGINEFIAYIHADNSGHYSLDDKKINLTLKYDVHYCQHFKNYKSCWTFELSDWVSESLTQEFSISVDGKDIQTLTRLELPFKILISPGVGLHQIEIQMRNKK